VSDQGLQLSSDGKNSSTSLCPGNGDVKGLALLEFCNLICEFPKKKKTAMGYHHLQGDMSPHNVKGDVPFRQQSDNTLF